MQPWKLVSVNSVLPLNTYACLFEFNLTYSCTYTLIQPWSCSFPSSNCVPLPHTKPSQFPRFNTLVHLALLTLVADRAWKLPTMEVTLLTIPKMRNLNFYLRFALLDRDSTCIVTTFEAMNIEPIDLCNHTYVRRSYSNKLT